MLELEQIKQNYLLTDAKLKPMLILFIDSTRKDFELINVAYIRNNLDEVRMIAHKLKAAYAYLGLEEGIKVFEEIRTRIINNDSSDLLPLITQAYELRKEAVNDINRIIKK